MQSAKPALTASNPMRIANGLEPIVPAPDAYDPVDENELPYGFRYEDFSLEGYDPHPHIKAEVA